jgi:hypothetical protein
MGMLGRHARSEERGVASGEAQDLGEASVAEKAAHELAPVLVTGARLGRHELPAAAGCVAGVGALVVGAHHGPVAGAPAR